MSPTQEQRFEPSESAIPAAPRASSAVECESSTRGEFDRSQPWRAISLRTVGGAFAGLVAIALVQSAAVMAAGNDHMAAGMMATWGGVLLELIAGATIVVVAMQLPEPLARRTWVLIGIAATCGAVWDTDWTYHQGAPLSANAAEVGVLQVLLFAAFAVALGACVWYSLSFRDRTRLRGPVLETLGIGAVVVVTLWIKVLQPALAQTRLPTDQIAGYAMIGLGDIAFSLLPMLLVTLTIARVAGPNGHRPDWVRMQPWMTGVVGAALTTFSSAGYVYRLAFAPWTPGLLLDFTYLLGYLAFAAAVMLERDAQRVLRESAA